MFTRKPIGRILPPSSQLLVVNDNPWHSLVCTYSTLIAAFVVMWLSPPCVFLPTSFKDTSHIGLKAHSSPVWSISHLLSAFLAIFKTMHERERKNLVYLVDILLPFSRQFKIEVEKLSANFPRQMNLLHDKWQNQNLIGWIGISIPGFL